MRILLLAPQPFYRERGTPIAVNLLLQSLSERGHMIDVATYHEGSDVVYPNVRIIRTPRIPFVHDIRPGLSFKKLLCDVFLFFKAVSLAGKTRPDIVHAVEESLFIAWFIRRLYGIPYIYDMDSSMPDQIVEKWPSMKLVARSMHALTRIAAHSAVLVAPVCDELAQVAGAYHPRKIIVLHDCSLLRKHPDPALPNVRESLALTGTCFMYVGNLESYQGIDLLLASFAIHHRNRGEDSLVIVGGTAQDIEKYKGRARALGIEKNTHFLGPQPTERLASYLEAADVLVSPRTKGGNTPMKIYSYIDSGRAVLATRLSTHTQVLTDQIACLAEPDAKSFSAAMLTLSADPELRARLGRAAQQTSRSVYSFDAFRRTLGEIYVFAESAIADMKSPAEAMPASPRV